MPPHDVATLPVKADLDRAPAPAGPRIRIERMTSADIRPVLTIEMLSFSTQWPPSAFASEVNDNKLACYFVARPDSPAQASSSEQGTGQIIGYGGIWVVLEDAHVTSVAVHPHWRGQHIGEAIFVRLLREAIEGGASWMTLEVRRSNVVAQALYGKYGFAIISTRRSYYSDDGEDALVMWAGNLGGAIYRAHLDARERQLQGKVATRSL